MKKRIITENNNERIKEADYDIIYIKHILPKVMWGVGFSIKGTEGAELYEGLDNCLDE